MGDGTKGAVKKAIPPEDREKDLSTGKPGGNGNSNGGGNGDTPHAVHGSGDEPTSRTGDRFAPDPAETRNRFHIDSTPEGIPEARKLKGEKQPLQVEAWLLAQGPKVQMPTFDSAKDADNAVDKSWENLKTAIAKSASDPAALAGLSNRFTGAVGLSSSRRVEEVNNLDTKTKGVGAKSDYIDNLSKLRQFSPSSLPKHGQLCLEVRDTFAKKNEMISINGKNVLAADMEIAFRAALEAGMKLDDSIFKPLHQAAYAHLSKVLKDPDRRKQLEEKLGKSGLEALDKRLAMAVEALGIKENAAPAARRIPDEATTPVPPTPAAEAMSPEKVKELSPRDLKQNFKDPIVRAAFDTAFDKGARAALPDNGDTFNDPNAISWKRIRGQFEDLDNPDPKVRKITFDQYKELFTFYKAALTTAPGTDTHTSLGTDNTSTTDNTNNNVKNANLTGIPIEKIEQALRQKEQSLTTNEISGENQAIFQSVNSFMHKNEYVDKDGHLNPNKVLKSFDLDAQMFLGRNKDETITGPDGKPKIITPADGVERIRIAYESLKNKEALVAKIGADGVKPPSDETIKFLQQFKKDTPEETQKALNDYAGKNKAQAAELQAKLNEAFNYYLFKYPYYSPGSSDAAKQDDTNLTALVGGDGEQMKKFLSAFDGKRNELNQQNSSGEGVTIARQIGSVIPAGGSWSLPNDIGTWAGGIGGIFAVGRVVNALAWGYSKTPMPGRGIARVFEIGTNWSQMPESAVRMYSRKRSTGGSWSELVPERLKSLIPERLKSLIPWDSRKPSTGGSMDWVNESRRKWFIEHYKLMDLQRAKGRGAYGEYGLFLQDVYNHLPLEVLNRNDYPSWKKCYEMMISRSIDGEWDSNTHWEAQKSKGNWVTNIPRIGNSLFQWRGIYAFPRLSGKARELERAGALTAWDEAQARWQGQPTAKYVTELGKQGVLTEAELHKMTSSPGEFLQHEMRAAEIQDMAWRYRADKLRTDGVQQKNKEADDAGKVKAAVAKDFEQVQKLAVQINNDAKAALNKVTKEAADMAVKGKDNLAKVRTDAVVEKKETIKELQEQAKLAGTIKTSLTEKVAKVDAARGIVDADLRTIKRASEIDKNLRAGKLPGQDKKVPDSFESYAQPLQAIVNDPQAKPADKAAAQRLLNHAQEAQKINPDIAQLPQFKAVDSIPGYKQCVADVVTDNSTQSFLTEEADGQPADKKFSEFYKEKVDATVSAKIKGERSIETYKTLAKVEWTTAHSALEAADKTLKEKNTAVADAKAKLKAAGPAVNPGTPAGTSNKLNVVELTKEKDGAVAEQRMAGEKAVEAARTEAAYSLVGTDLNGNKKKGYVAFSKLTNSSHFTGQQTSGHYLGNINQRRLIDPAAKPVHDLLATEVKSTVGVGRTEVYAMAWGPWKPSGEQIDAKKFNTFVQETTTGNQTKQAAQLAVHQTADFDAEIDRLAKDSSGTGAEAEATKELKIQAKELLETIDGKVLLAGSEVDIKTQLDNAVTYRMWKEAVDKVKPPSNSGSAGSSTSTGPVNAAQAAQSAKQFTEARKFLKTAAARALAKTDVLGYHTAVVHIPNPVRAPEFLKMSDASLEKEVADCRTYDDYKDSVTAIKDAGSTSPSLKDSCERAIKEADAAKEQGIPVSDFIAERCMQDRVGNFTDLVAHYRQNAADLDKKIKDAQDPEEKAALQFDKEVLEFLAEKAAAEKVKTERGTDSPKFKERVAEVTNSYAASRIHSWDDLLDHHQERITDLDEKIANAENASQKAAYEAEKKAYEARIKSVSEEKARAIGNDIPRKLTDFTDPTKKTFLGDLSTWEARAKYCKAQYDKTKPAAGVRGDHAPDIEQARWFDLWEYAKNEHQKELDGKKAQPTLEFFKITERPSVDGEKPDVDHREWTKTIQPFDDPERRLEKLLTRISDTKNPTIEKAHELAEETRKTFIDVARTVLTDTGYNMNDKGPLITGKEQAIIPNTKGKVAEHVRTKMFLAFQSVLDQLKSDGKNNETALNIIKTKVGASVDLLLGNLAMEERTIGASFQLELDRTTGPERPLDQLKRLHDNEGEKAKAIVEEAALSEGIRFSAASGDDTDFASDVDSKCRELLEDLDSEKGIKDPVKSAAADHLRELQIKMGQAQSNDKSGVVILREMGRNRQADALRASMTEARLDAARATRGVTHDLDEGSNQLSRGHEAVIKELQGLDADDDESAVRTVRKEVFAQAVDKCNAEGTDTNLAQHIVTASNALLTRVSADSIIEDEIEEKVSEELFELKKAAKQAAVEGKTASQFLNDQRSGQIGGKFTGTRATEMAIPKAKDVAAGSPARVRGATGRVGDPTAAAATGAQTEPEIPKEKLLANTESDLDKSMDRSNPDAAMKTATALVCKETADRCKGISLAIKTDGVMKYWRDRFVPRIQQMELAVKDDPTIPKATKTAVLAGLKDLREGAGLTDMSPKAYMSQKGGYEATTGTAPPESVKKTEPAAGPKVSPDKLLANSNPDLDAVIDRSDPRKSAEAARILAFKQTAEACKFPADKVVKTDRGVVDFYVGRLERVFGDMEADVQNDLTIPAPVRRAVVNELKDVREAAVQVGIGGSPKYHMSQGGYELPAPPAPPPHQGNAGQQQNPVQPIDFAVIQNDMNTLFTDPFEPFPEDRDAAVHLLEQAAAHIKNQPNGDARSAAMLDLAKQVRNAPSSSSALDIVTRALKGRSGPTGGGGLHSPPTGHAYSGEVYHADGSTTVSRNRRGETLPDVRRRIERESKLTKTSVNATTNVSAEGFESVSINTTAVPTDAHRISTSAEGVFDGTLQETNTSDVAKNPHNPYLVSEKLAPVYNADSKTSAALGRGMRMIHAGKALYYAFKGDKEQALHHGEAAGTMWGMHQAFTNKTVHKVGTKLIVEGTEKLGGKLTAAGAEKLGGKLTAAGAEKLLGKIATYGPKIAGREVPVLGAGISLYFSHRSARSKETWGDSISERASGAGEAVLGTVASPFGLGFAGGEVGREAMNGLEYLSTFGKHSGDPSLTRMLWDEGMGATEAIVAARMIPNIEKSALNDQAHVSIRAFALADGHQVAIPKMEAAYPQTPKKIQERLADIPGASYTERLYRMMGLAKQEKLSHNPLGSSCYSEVHDELSQHFRQMEVYEDSARQYLDFARRFNEESRPKLVEQLRKAQPYLDGKTAEDMVPMLDVGASQHLDDAPKITAQKYPDAYALLQRSVQPGVDVDSLTSKQQHHLLREAIPAQAVQLSTWQKIAGGKEYEELNRAHQQYSQFMQQEYIPYTHKLVQLSPAIRQNEAKVEALVADLNIVQKREKIAMLETQVQTLENETAIDMKPLLESEAYKQKDLTVATLAKAKVPTHGDEETYLDACADLLITRLVYVEKQLEGATSTKPEANSIDWTDLGAF